MDEAKSDLRSEEYVQNAIFKTRARFHLVYRLTIRTIQLFATGGAAQSASLRFAVLLFVGIDLLIWWALRDPRRYGLAWRLPLDAADVAFWSFHAHPATGFYDLAVLVAVPLGIEAAFRQGLRGGLAMGLIPLTTALTRVAAGRPVHLFTFGWLVLAVVFGAALPRYCKRLQRQVNDEHDDRLAADCYRAYLGGQNAVAMGASSVVDAIENVIPLLGQPPSNSALWALADGWKADLGRSTAGRATYLLTALRQWEAVYNRDPDLSSDVNFHLPEGEGTTLLTAPQVDELDATLAAMDLRGDVLVRVDDRAGARRTPGGPLRLEVDGHLLQIRADQTRPPRPVDPGPISFVYIAAFLARGAAPNGENIPLTIIAIGVAMCLAAAWWSHRQLGHLGRAARPSILFMATGIALLYTTLASLTMRNLFTPEGDRLYGFSAGLLLLAFLTGYYHESLTPKQRRTAFSLAAVVWVLGCALPGGPSTPLGLLLSIPFAITPYPPCLLLSQELEGTARRHAREVPQQDAAMVQAAFARGSTEVVAMVARARDEAREQFEQVRRTLDPLQRNVAASRLADIDRRLDLWQPGRA